MMLTLSADLEEFVRQKVRSGLYESSTQVVEEALLLLEERDHLTQVRRERLLRELASGVFQANNRQLVDGAQVFAGLQNQANATGE